MTGDDVTNRVQRSQTIWHETQSAPGQGQRKELALFKGQLELANGETAICAGVEVIDVSDEKEPFAGYLIVLLADGSVSNQTFEGIVTRRESATSLGGTGTWRLTNGTGKFAKLRGGGSFTWKMDGDNYHSEYSA